MCMCNMCQIHVKKVLWTQHKIFTTPQKNNTSKTRDTNYATSETKSESTKQSHYHNYQILVEHNVEFNLNQINQLLIKNENLSEMSLQRRI